MYIGKNTIPMDGMGLKQPIQMILHVSHLQHPLFGSFRRLLCTAVIRPADQIHCSDAEDIPGQPMVLNICWYILYISLMDSTCGFPEVISHWTKHSNHPKRTSCDPSVHTNLSVVGATVYLFPWLPPWEVTYPLLKTLLSRWFAFSLSVGYVILHWRVSLSL